MLVRIALGAAFSTKPRISTANGNHPQNPVDPEPAFFIIGLPIALP
jgi:hypothetical protein